MTTHLTPDPSGRTRCCGRLPSELPLADGFTVDEGKKTCRWSLAETEAGPMHLPPLADEKTLALADAVYGWSSIPADSEAKVASVELMRSEPPMKAIAAAKREAGSEVAPFGTKTIDELLADLDAAKQRCLEVRTGKLQPAHTVGFTVSSKIMEELRKQPRATHLDVTSIWVNESPVLADDEYMEHFSDGGMTHHFKSTLVFDKPRSFVHIENNSGEPLVPKGGVPFKPQEPQR